MRKPGFLLILSLLVCTFLFADINSKPDNLIVYGNGWAFTIKEPSGWQGDTTLKLLQQFEANIIFYNKAIGVNKSPLIKVLVTTKQDENTAEDLNYDMTQYKAKYANIQFEDFFISHLTYKCFQRLFYVNKSFYEYVVYINPGKKYKWLISVSMNKQKSKATKDELVVFNDIVSSIQLLGNIKVRYEKK